MTEAGHFTKAKTATCDQIIQGCKWLKTPAGRDGVVRRQFNEKLAKQAAKKNMSVQDLALLKIYWAAKEDLHKERNATRRKYQDKIKALELKINAIHAEREKVLTEVSDKYRFAADFKVLKPVELKKQCWDANIDELRELGRNVPNKSEALMGRAVDKYKDAVEESHLLEYLKDPVRQVQMSAYSREIDTAVAGGAEAGGGSRPAPRGEQEDSNSRRAKRARRGGVRA